MNILILNTSYSRPFSCLVIEGEERKVYSHFDTKNVKHSEDTLSVIDGFLNEAKVNIKDVDVIAVNLGPGSFTGIRVGVALAKGFACARKVKLVAFNSMEQILKFSGSESALLKANNDEYYFGKVIDGKVEIGIVQNSEASGYEYSDEDDFSAMIEASVEVVLNKVKNNELVSINELNPIYLKLSQAERELLLKEKLNGNN